MLPLFWKVTPSLDCFGQIASHFHVQYANLTRKSSVPAVFDLHFLEITDDKKTPPLFHFRVREKIVLVPLCRLWVFPVNMASLRSWHGATVSVVSQIL